MILPNEETIARLLLDDSKVSADPETVFKYIGYYKLLWKLREIGEYSAAVEYLAKSLAEQDEKEKSFTLFCDAVFHSRANEEMKIAHDAVETVRCLTDERHFVFSLMQSEAGKKLHNLINKQYACPRGLRYNAIRSVITQYRTANIADIGCGEARLEEHVNLMNDGGDYRFNAADRSSYILVQAQYRNRFFNNIRYFQADYTEGFERKVFDFDKEAPLIVVVSEFIEHLSKSRGIALLREILCSVRPAELIVTTPNRDFSLIYKKEDPNNLVHKYEYPQKDFAHEMHSLVKCFYDLYFINALHGIAGKPGLPQSLFLRITRRKEQ